MTDWERFEADIFPGRAWKLEGKHQEVQVVDNPDGDGVIMFTVTPPSRRERVIRKLKSWLPLVSGDYVAQKTGLPFESEEEAKEVGEAIIQQFG